MPPASRAHNLLHFKPTACAVGLEQCRQLRWLNSSFHTVRALACYAEASTEVSIYASVQADMPKRFRNGNFEDMSLHSPSDRCYLCSFLMNRIAAFFRHVAMCPQRKNSS